MQVVVSPDPGHARASGWQQSADIDARSIGGFLWQQGIWVVI
jgi:hypothetical protein